MSARDEKCDVPTGFIDDFADDGRPGAVIGRRSATGIPRNGVDAEGVISIDHGALRIAPLVEPGWARSGIAYGPYRRANGLTFAVFVLNGHNTSQVGNLAQSLGRRLGRWAKGSGGASGLGHRMLIWLWKGDKRMFLRQLRRWRWLSLQAPEGSSGLNENLAVGWFASVAPGDPHRDGNAIVMHAAGPENGLLCANAGNQPLPVIRGVQNLPVYYVVVLRERGAVYYAASLDGARGLDAPPLLRPLAVDAHHGEDEVYAGLHQSVLGQIGFRVDTRVYSAQVAQLAELGEWYGTAHAADRLRGAGPVSDVPAETGGRWTAHRGRFERTSKGARPSHDESLVVLDPGTPSGLVHVLVGSEDRDAAASVVWRFKDEDNHWCLGIAHDTCRLSLMLEGHRHELGAASGTFLQSGKTGAVQIVDNGDMIGIYFDGRLLFGSPIADLRLADATGAGIATSASPHRDVHFAFFEAHPRTVTMPHGLVLPMPWQERGDQVAVRDAFAGPAGPLDGRATGTGEIWKRNLGTGSFDLSGEGYVQVRASVREPNPGRTAYVLPWDTPEFADVAVTITPPGSGRDEGEMGRGGLIFWQDPDNYIIINNWLDDFYKGASVSSFFHLGGFEELYDAVWTNVGERIRWGRPYRLRVTFDGHRYLAYVNDEPVLYRALTDVYPAIARLAIKRVGIAANWEWGDDTGSKFTDFVALRKEARR